MRPKRVSLQYFVLEFLSGNKNEKCSISIIFNPPWSPALSGVRNVLLDSLDDALENPREGPFPDQLNT